MKRSFTGEDQQLKRFKECSILYPGGRLFLTDQNITDIINPENDGIRQIINGKQIEILPMVTEPRSKYVKEISKYELDQNIHEALEDMIGSVYKLLDPNGNDYFTFDTRDHRYTPNSIWISEQLTRGYLFAEFNDKNVIICQKITCRDVYVTVIVTI